MNDFEVKLVALKNALFDLPEVKAFFAARAAILSNDELQTLAREVAAAQRTMATSMGDEQAHQCAKSHYEELQTRYDTHPDILNYRSMRDEIAQLLDQIKTLIE